MKGDRGTWPAPVLPFGVVAGSSLQLGQTSPSALGQERVKFEEHLQLFFLSLSAVGQERSGKQVYSSSNLTPRTGSKATLTQTPRHKTELLFLIFLVVLS